ncbi:ATP-binding cassette domain-containing protein [Mycoplasma sp. P36-A1]|uniref:ABC transporter ATP-binding protein n=1 Tax=Mycoplasma sp. P36-A1 TaxID=3252900 RepID=UPI003C302B15
MIELINASKKYRGRIVLNNISLTFNDNKAYGISGVNGSGKTQLLKAICGYIVLNSGSVMQDNNKIRNKYNFIHNAGILIGDPEFIPDKTVIENLLLIASIQNKCDKKRLSVLLKYFNLESFKDEQYSKLSLGSKKKMLIIQAIMDYPKVLILDEPFNALDKKTSEKLRSFLVHYKKNNLLILTSHNENDLEIICDEIFEIEEGMIIWNYWLYFYCLF